VTARTPAILLVHAFVGWAQCAATMGLGMAVTTIETTLVVYALLAPIFFAALGLVYFLRFNLASPLQTAAFFLAFVIGMDLFVVAPLSLRSLAMFASPPGTWIPFAAIFLATYRTGVFARRVIGGART